MLMRLTHPQTIPTPSMEKLPSSKQALSVKKAGNRWFKKQLTQFIMWSVCPESEKEMNF